MIGAEEFGPDFQRLLVRLCMDDFGLRGLIDRYIRAGNLGWTDPTALWVWRVMQAAGDRVSRLRLETEAARLSQMDPARLGLPTVLSPALDVRDLEFIREKVIEWARMQTFRLAYNESAQAWQAGDVAEAQRIMLTRIEEINALRVEIADRGWFFEELQERQSDRWRSGQTGEVFPIGINKIDAAMNGGLHRGELEIPIAYSGIGKTFWAVQRGFLAAKMRSRVIHFILEGGRKKTADRYEARFAGTMYREVKAGNIEIDVFMEMQAEYAALRECLVLRGTADQTEAWTFNFAGIVAELADLRRTRGWVPDVIVVDYGDLLAEEGDNDREKQKAAFRKLKTLSERIEYPGHRGYAVCSPSQAVRPDRGADEREHVLMPRDIADCYEKVRVADAVLSINRTNAEKAAAQARVALGKYRDDEDGVVVRVRTDYERGGFSRLFEADEPEPPEDPDAGDDGSGGASKPKVKRRKGDGSGPPPAPKVPPPPPPLPGVGS